MLYFLFIDQLKENNEMMKQQYQNLLTWKEKIRQTNVQNKEKYDQTRQVVVDLRQENSDLKQKVEELSAMKDSSQDVVNIATSSC